MPLLKARPVKDPEAQLNFEAVEDALHVGNGSPEGVVAASPGAIYEDRASGLLYRKSGGNGKNGWAGLTSGVAISVSSAIMALAPASFWKFDEIAGGLVDAGSAGVAGAFVSGTRSRKGYGGSLCVDVQLDTALGTFGDNYRFTGNAPFTVLCLHRQSVAGGASSRPLVVKENAAATIGWRLMYNSFNLLSFFRLQGGAIASDFTPTLDDWNLCAGTYDGATLSNYLNGIYKSGVADAVAMTGTADNLRVNGTAADVFGAKGRYDCAAIWNRALSQAELDSIWAAL